MAIPGRLRNVSRMSVAGTTLDPPDETAKVAAPMTRGALPNRFEIRTRTCRPPSATVASCRTMASSAMTPGCAHAMAEPQATLQANGCRDSTVAERVPRVCLPPVGLCPTVAPDRPVPGGELPLL